MVSREIRNLLREINLLQGNYAPTKIAETDTKGKDKETGPGRPLPCRTTPVIKNDAEVIELRPQPGPQEMFLSTPADIAIYGGAAGGGKSSAFCSRQLGIPTTKTSAAWSSGGPAR
jgi:hypothetical protein